MMKQRITQLRQWAMERDWPLIVLLLNSWSFLTLAIFMISCLILVPLSAWKIIRVTPTGMMPIIKVSALDLIQAEALSRRAQTLNPESDQKSLFETLAMAIGNSPGNIRYNRQYLDALIKHDLKRDHWLNAARTGHWLLKLSRTNQVDVERALSAFNHYGMHNFTVELYESLPSRGSGTAEHEYFAALLEVGTVQRLDKAWRERPNEAVDHKILRLILSGLQAVSDDPQKAAIGLKQIEQASHSQDLEAKALRLRRLVALHQQDVAAFESHLKRSEEIFRVSLYDHLAFWDMLVKDNRKEQALREATTYVMKPRTTREVVSLGNAYYRLGLRDLAFRYLKNYVNDYGFSSAAWFTQAHLLVEKEDWGALHHLARQLRATHGVSQANIGFSHYLDAKAFSEKGQSFAAEQSAETLLTYSFKESDLGLYVASNLWELDLIEATVGVLWNERTRYHNDPVFWDLCMRAAARLDRGAQAIIAAKNLYRIDPKSPTARANYAALLMSEQDQLDHALALTLDATLQYPTDMDLRVNYARALSLNTRHHDAIDVMNRIDIKALSPNGLNAYRFVSMALFLNLNKHEETRAIAESIAPARLLPGDRAEFQRLRKTWQRDEPHEPKVFASL